MEIQLSVTGHAPHEYSLTEGWTVSRQVDRPAKSDRQKRRIEMWTGKQENRSTRVHVFGNRLTDSRIDRQRDKQTNRQTRDVHISRHIDR